MGAVQRRNHAFHRRTALLSKRIAEPAARALRLRTFAPPLSLATSHVGQVWHERLGADEGHRCIRRLIRDVARCA
ncbi:MAG: hypothetical protein U0174_02790 [Polyangiaceae bacterium]